MYRFIPIALVIALLAVALLGCEEENRKPYITRTFANQPCGVAPVQIEFYVFATGGNPLDNPTGANDYLDIAWDLGDGSSATGSLVFHTYSDPGTYTVVVRATDADGDVTDPDTLQVVVRADSLDVNALAVYDGEPINVAYTCEDIQFDVIAEACGFDPVTGDYDRLVYEWRMDDPTQTVYHGRRPRHRFGSEGLGDHEVELTVWDPPSNLTRSDTYQFEIIEQTAEPGIVLEAAPTEAGIGDVVTHTLTVTNNGAETAVGVRVQLGINFLAQFVRDVTYEPSQGRFDEEEDIWVVGDLSPQGSAAMTFLYTVARHAIGSLQTSAELLSRTCDEDVSNNHATATFQVAGADIDLAMTVNNNTPAPGDTVQFVVSTRNLGPAAATGVKVQNRVPEGLNFVAHMTTQGEYDFTTGSWRVGQLPMGGQGTLYLAVAVSDTSSAGTAFSNSAQVTDSDQGDPNNENNGATQSITVQNP